MRSKIRGITQRERGRENTVAASKQHAFFFSFSLVVELREREREREREEKRESANEENKSRHVSLSHFFQFSSLLCAWERAQTMAPIAALSRAVAALATALVVRVSGVQLLWIVRAREREGASLIVNCVEYYGERDGREKFQPFLPSHFSAMRCSSAVIF
jgi:hypothetical protein